MRVQAGHRWGREQRTGQLEHQSPKPDAPCSEPASSKDEKESQMCQIRHSEETPAAKQPAPTCTTTCVYPAGLRNQRNFLQEHKRKLKWRKGKMSGTPGGQLRTWTSCRSEVAGGPGLNISRSAPQTLQLEGRHHVPIRCQAHQCEQIPKIPAVTGRHQAAILSGKETIDKE